MKFRLFLDLEWIFNRLALEMSFRRYELSVHPWKRMTREYILEFVEPTDVILDLGCASGDIARAIASKAKYVVGVDHNPKLIGEAKGFKQQDNLSFVYMDALEYLETSDRTFNKLILSHILEHIDNPVDFLKSYTKFFDYIYIEVPDFDGTILNQFRKDEGLDLIHTDNDHVTEFDRHELVDIFDHCGLRIVRSELIFDVQRYWCKVDQNLTQD